MSSPIPVYQKSIQDLKFLVFEIFKEESVTVILFGSRARGNFNQVSETAGRKTKL
jgi:predicted nucleotidyltransferase